LVTSKPLRAIAGKSGHGKDITLFMHEGYDRLIISPDVLLNRLWSGVLPKGQLCHVWGSLENPAFSWPVYALSQWDQRKQ
jgi:hypothetical protein